MTVISISDNELLPSERVSIAVITLSKCESVTFLDFQVNLYPYLSFDLFFEFWKLNYIHSIAIRLDLSLMESLLKLLFVSLAVARQG